jgi:hypothetical protein
VLIDIHALLDMTIPKRKEAQSTTKAVQPASKRPKRSELSVAEKMDILTLHNSNGKKQKKTAEHFRSVFSMLSQPTVSRK